MAKTAFTLAIDKWIAKAKQAPQDVVLETIQDINEEVVEMQPVITGTLRRSWYAGIGRIPEGIQGGNADPVGSMNIVAQGLEPGQTYYAVNRAVYARRVEFGFVGADSLGRVYNQTGRHTVSAVMTRAPAIAEAAAMRVAARYK